MVHTWRSEDSFGQLVLSTLLAEAGVSIVSALVNAPDQLACELLETPHVTVRVLGLKTCTTASGLLSGF